MSTKQSPFLQLLPTELTVSILEQLSYADLLKCKKVCRRLRSLIEECVSLQYTLQLAVAGMEDNQYSTLNKVDKMTLLSKYRRTWDRLDVEDVALNQQIVPIQNGPAWEFTGGVLAQSVGIKAIEFRQLSSSLRGIQEKVWTTELGFNIIDFTADPGQDLLVALQAGRRKECVARFVSMSTGQRHREARRETVSFERRSTTRPTTHEIRVNGPYVGVLLKEIHSSTPWCHLSVWEWRTGVEICAITQPYWSFCFFDEHYLLLADFLPRDPKEAASSRGSLVVLDLTDLQRRWRFQLPTCSMNVSVYNMELLSEPGSRWTPSPALATPFYVSREDRLIVLIMHVTDDTIAEDYAITFSMLSSQLSAYVRQRVVSTEETIFLWEGWGMQSCRAITSPFFWEGIWPCCVYGTKHIVQEEGRAVIYDFNPATIQEHLSGQRTEPNDGETVVIASSGLDEDLFIENVATSLPYRRIKTKFKMSEVDSVMFSEDSIVIVRDDEEQFHIASL